MGKRRKQATLQVAATGRVHLTGQPARERSLSPAQQARADRHRRAQRSLAKHHQPTWTELQEQGRIDDHGETVTSESEEDQPKGLVEQLQLVPQSTSSDEEDDQNEDDGAAESQEAAADSRRQINGRQVEHKLARDTDDEDDEDPLPTPKKHHHVKTITLSSSGEEADEEVEVQQPVASTSKAVFGKAPSPFDGRRNGTPPARKRQRSTSVFEGVVIDSPARRKAPTATAAINKDRQIEAIVEEREPTHTSEDDLPAPRLNSSARKRLLVSSSSSSSSGGDSPARQKKASPGASSDEDLPVPASIATDNKRLKAQREARLNNAALRGPRKNGKRRKIDTKRRLTALSQGTRDRRSADEDSAEEDFVVEDDDEIVYDTPSGVEDEDSEPVAPRMSAKKKGKQRAVSEDEEEVGAREKRNGESKKRLKGGKSRSQVQRELLASSSDDSEEAMRRKKKRKAGRGRDRSASQDAEGRKKRRRRKRRSASSGSDATPSGSDADVDDEPEDLEILDEETVLEEKFRSRVKDDKFAALKATRERKKTRQAIVVESEDEEFRPTQKAAGHTASQPRFLGDPDHRSSDEEESGSDGSRSSGESGTSSSESNTADSDASFIIEDDGNDAEVTKFRAGLQLKLQGMRHHYKTYILFLIYQIIDPDHDWRADDNELREADQRVTDALKSTISSVGSSAWKPRFLKAINSRPELDVDDLPAEERGGPCEVCQQGAARHATALLTLRGPKYNRRTLKDLLPAEDSSAIEDSDSDDDNPSARKSRDKYYEFHSGISCTNRAEMYHQLRHWAYTTRNRVEEMLAPYRKPIMVPKLTSGMSKSERREARQLAAERKNEEANRLSKLLDEQGVIDEFVDRLQRELDVIIKSIAK